MIGKSTLSIVSAEARADRNTFPFESVAIFFFWTVRVDGALFEAVSVRGFANSSINIGIFDTFTILATVTW